jgi:hypothetical protein
MNNFEKNKLIISTELEKKREIKKFLIKEKMKNLKPTIYSISFFTIIVTIFIFSFSEILATILSIILFGSLSTIIAYVTYFDTPKGNQIEKELRLVQQDILRLEIEKINPDSL